MKNITAKIIMKKQSSPSKYKINPLENAYLHDSSQFSFPSPNQSNKPSLSTQMLVSLNQTQHFKLDYIIDSYQSLITSFKLQRKNFLSIMKSQFEKHLFYYTQIITLAKTHQQNTKAYLKSKMQDISNLFQLKISLIETKLKNARKLLFQNDSNCIFRKKLIKIRQSNSSKRAQVGKTSSYEEGIDFDQELKEIYHQKSFQLQLNFIQEEEVADSLHLIKTQMIGKWQARDSRSISFSSITNPEQQGDTFFDVCNGFELEKENQIFETQRDFLKQKTKQDKSYLKNNFTSSDTNTSFKQKSVFPSPLMQYFHTKNNSNFKFQV